MTTTENEQHDIVWACRRMQDDPSVVFRKSAPNQRLTYEHLIVNGQWTHLIFARLRENAASPWSSWQPWKPTQDDVIATDWECE
jgi:hypothetical protein